MTQEVIIAGFGGQGVMLIGKLLSYAGMMEGKNVSFIPSYGPEMRGGTANCAVVVSDEQIGSPVVTEPDVLIAMNRPSLGRFEQSVKPGGLVIYNRSLIDIAPARSDVTVVGIDANNVADALGNPRVANMVVVGAYAKASSALSRESIVKALTEVIPKHRSDLIPLNEEAIARGFSLA